MSKYLHELSCSIIQDFYGEFYARIYHHLTHNGRYTANQVAQKSHLPLRQVKAGLAALVQLRLIYHHTTQEGLSTYQANTRSAYDILRSGKLINLAQSKHGDLAADIIAEAFLLGFTTVGELEDRVLQSFSVRIPGSTNGTQQNTETSLPRESDVRNSIQALLESGFLTHARVAHFQTEFDAGQDVESYLRTHGLVPALKTRKAQIELEERVSAEVRNRQSAAVTEQGYVPSASTGSKRSTNDSGGRPGKRIKMSNGTSTEHQSDVLIRINYVNLIANTRNQYLGEIAEQALGLKISRVLSSALSQVPASDPFDHPPNEHWLDLTVLRDILNGADNDTDGVTNGRPKINGIHSQNGHSYHSSDGDEHISYGELDRHLALLSESMFDFMQGGYSKDQWKISQRDLNAFTRQKEALRIMGSRLGSPALRLVRMLTEKGKLDEKSLQETGLLGAKELRQTLAQLSQLGYIDLQEVPREAQRQPNRTIFLWFHDPERVRKILLEDVYKSMTRLMQRLHIERNGLSSTLEKVGRSDVKGSEDQMLPAGELKVWKRWQKKERWILGELSRLDDSVTILRDL